MRVTATRVSGRTGPDYVSYVGLPDELLKLAKDADFVVNCAPLTSQTTGIFNREFFASLKPGAYFVSVGRGRSTVTADLIAALNSGKLAGAGLDVFAEEPRVPEVLFDLDTVVLEPHQASATVETRMAMGQLVVDNVAAHFAGQALLTAVI